MRLAIEGKIALVTGADSGIGFETARQLLMEGVRVAISDQTDASLTKAVEALSGLGEVIGVRADVTKLDDVRALFADFLAVDDEGWRTTLDVILFGAVRVCREAIPAMRHKIWGRIVLIASGDGVQPYTDDLAYCASRAGVINLAKGLSKAYGEDDVVVNTVSPAFIHTPMTDAMMANRAAENGSSVDEAIDSFLQGERPGMVLKRRGRPEEVAAMILFLCSERSRFITGSNMRVDSGSVATI